MANIGIIGSGNVGANTAFFLAERKVADVLLYDIQEGLATGKTLDMMEAAPIRGYQTTLAGTDSLDDVIAAPIIMIAAGSVREPGMKREDLLATNRSLIEEFASRLAGHSGTVIIATEPVDLLTAIFVQASGLPRERVLGVGGILDGTRLRYLLAHELGVTMEDVTATVIGRHADSMIPLKSHTTVGGVPVGSLLPQERISELFDETRRAGNLIVDMAKRASAYYGPSAAACDLAEAIVRNTNRVLSVSFVLDGELGVSGVAMSLPATIGSSGITRVLVPTLSDEERQQFTRGAEELASILQGGTK